LTNANSFAQAISTLSRDPAGPERARLLHDYALHRASADAQRLADLQYAGAALVKARMRFSSSALRPSLRPELIARSMVKRPLVAMVVSIVQMVRERGSRAMAKAHSGRVGRRLAAIVAADVAGYSRLMGLDEVGTLKV
jgi:hypothetical protein